MADLSEGLGIESCDPGLQLDDSPVTEREMDDVKIACCLTDRA
jgi:hypothetical protein